MKANQHSLWQTDDRAQVGIGTMIVFIATILVAATAAAVLIDTSGKLQEKSSTTGDQATKQVASNLIVKYTSGARQTTSDDIDGLNITVALAPGADGIDLTQMKIVVNDGVNVDTYSYAAADADNKFVPTYLRDADTSTTVMNSGDLTRLWLNVHRISHSIAERKDVEVTLYPEIGSPVDSSFTTPETYGQDLEIWLR